LRHSEHMLLDTQNSMFGTEAGWVRTCLSV